MQAVSGVAYLVYANAAAVLDYFYEQNVSEGQITLTLARPYLHPQIRTL